MATPWAVPPMWVGRTVAILAPGDSLNAVDVDAVRAAGLPTIAVGDAYRLAPWADVLYHTDGDWWRHHAVALRRFAGLCVTLEVPAAGPRKRVALALDWVRSLEASGAEGIDPDPTKIRHGQNSGYAALHVAVHTGARRILLLGYDMHGTHFFGPHPKPLHNTAQCEFVHWCKRFGRLAPVLAERSVEVVNCTRRSALHCFPMRSLADELALAVA